MRRVVQFSTGNVGKHSLRAVIGRPDLELVGVHAAGPAKIGRDAADLCGLSEPTGIVATDDLDALIALRPLRISSRKRGQVMPRPMRCVAAVSSRGGLRSAGSAETRRRRASSCARAARSPSAPPRKGAAS